MIHGDTVMASHISQHYKMHSRQWCVLFVFKDFFELNTETKTVKEEACQIRLGQDYKFIG